MIPFKIKGTDACINSMGLPTVTSQKYVVMQAQGQSHQSENGKIFNGPTYLKVLYFDTSPSFFQRGIAKDSSQVIGEKAISNLFVVNSHLNAGRPAQVAKMALHVI